MSKKNGPGRTRRQKILEECEYKCAICDKVYKDELTLHHIKGRNVPKPNHRSNLLPLCISCHKSLNSLTNMARKGVDLSVVPKLVRLVQMYMDSCEHDN